MTIRDWVERARAWMGARQTPMAKHEAKAAWLEAVRKLVWT